MIFGDTDVKNASGCMLAHAINLNALKFPKGHTLSEADCEELYRNGINVVKVARLEDFDISENDAALIIAQAICSHEKIGRISIKRSRTGRVNLVAPFHKWWDLFYQKYSTYQHRYQVMYP